MEKEEIEEPKFLIREYSKIELSILYCPQMRTESAMKKLNRWVKGNAPLMQELEAVGFHPQRHSYSPREVGLIVRYLGTPG